jgi:release factor glutamine methyltransferase
MTVAELKQTVISAKEVSLPDFFVLLSFVTDKPKAFLFAHEEYALSMEEISLLLNLLKRRALHEPISYLTGTREFYGRNFSVNPSVLIPRPETEFLVERVLAATSSNTPATFIDIGTGSGAIILTLSEERKSMNEQDVYLGIDISPEALVVAKKNKESLQNISVEFFESDLLKAIPEKYFEGSLILLANLPYVPTQQYRDAMPDVRLYEPEIALVSGTDGLDHYRRLIQEIITHNISSFTLYLEIDPSQTTTLISVLESTFPTCTHTVIQDLQGHDRVIECVV